MGQQEGVLFPEGREQIVKLVRRWAGATTDAILDPSMQMFHVAGVEGLIAYRFECNSAIVFGDPTCAEEDRVTLTRAFHKFAEEQGKNVIYISVSKSFADWGLKNGCSTLIEFGKELILDPAQDPSRASGSHGSLVRRKVRAAARENVTVHEYLTRDPALEKAMEEVGEKWLKARRGVQIHISNIYLFNDTYGKRWFYAKQGDRLVGVVCLNRLQKHEGWLLNHLMALPDAPNGTSELLVTSALKTVGQEECRFVTVGVVTAKKLGVMVGLSRFSKWIACFMFKIARMVAHLDGLRTFWGKYNPQEQPSYILFSEKKIGIPEIIGIRRAMGG